jgi:molybdopterin converting factor subunit 1
MTIHVRLFAHMAQQAGVGALTLELAPEAPLASVKNEVLRRYPLLPWAEGMLLAVNQEYAPADTVLHNDDEVAIIPPVGGG